MYLFGDNKSVAGLTTFPASTCKKRHHLLSFHRVREAIAAKFIAFHWIEGKKNPADVLSKHWDFVLAWPHLKLLLFWKGDTKDCSDDVTPAKATIAGKGESYAAQNQVT